MDGIDLKQLLEDRVTLDGNETLTSHCIFEEIEVKGLAQFISSNIGYIL